MLMMAAATALFWRTWARVFKRSVPANATVTPLTWEDLRARREELGAGPDRLPCSCPTCRRRRRAS